MRVRKGALNMRMCTVAPATLLLFLTALLDMACLGEEGGLELRVAELTEKLAAKDAVIAQLKQEDSHVDTDKPSAVEDDEPLLGSGAGFDHSEWANPNSDTSCASGTHITSEAQCKEAAGKLGVEYKSAGSWPGDPPGCLYRGGGVNQAWFNSHPTGASSCSGWCKKNSIKPICNPPPTPPPTPATAGKKCPSGTARAGGYYLPAGSTTPGWLPSSSTLKHVTSTQIEQQRSTAEGQEELGEEEGGYELPTADVNNCFPLALPKGGSTMGKCSTCTVPKIYRQVDSNGRWCSSGPLDDGCNAVNAGSESKLVKEDYYLTLYKVDDNTGCGACPTGQQPWQMRSLTQSRFDSIQCSTETDKKCLFTNILNGLQSDCDTADCGARFYFCAHLPKESEKSQIECSPGLTHNSKFAGGTMGMTKGSCHASNPMECIKRGWSDARIYDSKGMPDTHASDRFNGKWQVVCNIWKMVSCIRLSGEVKCSSASRLTFRKAILENNYDNTAYARRPYTDISQMPIGMQEMHNETGLCSPHALAEG